MLLYKYCQCIDRKSKSLTRQNQRHAYLGYFVTYLVLTKSLKVLQGCFSVCSLPWRYCYCTDKKSQSLTRLFQCLILTLEILLLHWQKVSKSYKAVSVSDAYLGDTVTALTKSLSLTRLFQCLMLTLEILLLHWQKVSVLQGCFSVWCLPWRCCWCTDRRFQSQTSCLHCPLHGWFSEQVNNVSIINSLLCVGLCCLKIIIVIPCQQNCTAFPIKSPLSAEQSLTIHWILSSQCRICTYIAFLLVFTMHNLHLYHI